MRPSDQCRLCSCNFKVKCGNLSKNKRYFNRKSIQSEAKQGLQGTRFNTNLPVKFGIEVVNVRNMLTWITLFIRQEIDRR